MDLLLFLSALFAGLTGISRSVPVALPEAFQVCAASAAACPTSQIAAAAKAYRLVALRPQPTHPAARLPALPLAIAALPALLPARPVAPERRRE